MTGGIDGDLFSLEIHHQCGKSEVEPQKELPEEMIEKALAQEQSVEFLGEAVTAQGNDQQRKSNQEER